MCEGGPEGLGGRLHFLEHFAALDDPRQSKKVLYPLDEVLLLTLCAMLCGADGWVSVALFGEQKLAFLRQFLPFANGTPSHDQLGLVFGALDTAAFQTCFTAVKRATLNAFRKAPGKDSMKSKRLIAAWDEKYLAKILEKL